LRILLISLVKNALKQVAALYSTECFPLLEGPGNDFCDPEIAFAEFGDPSAVCLRNIKEPLLDPFGQKIGGRGLQAEDICVLAFFGGVRVVL
jgi:hypothetical protein